MYSKNTKARKDCNKTEKTPIRKYFGKKASTAELAKILNIKK